MPRIRELVVVITGASSGLGRATAHAFAKKGAKLVLGARGKTGLAAGLDECRRLGANAVSQTFDASDATSVEVLRETAVEAFGRIDVWVNCAAILALGLFEKTPPDVFRRVIETNVLGYANGARCALAQFRAQGAAR